MTNKEVSKCLINYLNTTVKAHKWALIAQRSYFSNELLVDTEDLQVSIKLSKQSKSNKQLGIIGVAHIVYNYANNTYLLNAFYPTCEKLNNSSSMQGSREFINIWLDGLNKYIR